MRSKRWLLFLIPALLMAWLWYAAYSDCSGTTLCLGMPRTQSVQEYWFDPSVPRIFAQEKEVNSCLGIDFQVLTVLDGCGWGYPRNAPYPLRNDCRIMRQVPDGEVMNGIAVEEWRRACDAIEDGVQEVLLTRANQS